MKTNLSIDDLIEREARVIAQGLLETQLKKHDLPLPKDASLTIHIDQILATNPQIRAAAQARVLASRDAYSESLRAIGLVATPPPRDILSLLDTEDEAEKGEAL